MRVMTTSTIAPCAAAHHPTRTHTQHAYPPHCHRPDYGSACAFMPSLSSPGEEGREAPHVVLAQRPIFPPPRVTSVPLFPKPDYGPACAKGRVVVAGYTQDRQRRGRAPSLPLLLQARATTPILPHPHPPSPKSPSRSVGADVDPEPASTLRWHIKSLPHIKRFYKIGVSVPPRSRCHRICKEFAL